MSSPVKDLVRKVLASAGYRIQRVPQSNPSRSPDAIVPNVEPTMLGGLARVHHLGVNLGTMIDVGASDGRWSSECFDYFPDARFLLVEARDVHEPGLRQLKRERSNVDYVIAAAGDHPGEVHFLLTEDPFGGGASHGAFHVADALVPMTTIDLLVAQHKLPPPYGIKLDTHGFELPILEGAAETLKQTELLIIEAYNFQMRRADPNLRFHELCAYMEARGFRCSDLVDQTFRDKDLILWQMDLFFIPATRPEFEYKGYS